MSARATLRVGALALALVVVGGLAATQVRWSTAAWDLPRVLGLIGLLALTVVLSARSLVLRSGTASQNVAPTEAMLVFSLLLGPPAALLVAVADVAGLVLRGLRSPLKILFDLVQQAAGLTVGVLVWQVLRGQASPIEARWALAALAGGMVAGLLSLSTTLLVHRLTDALEAPRSQAIMALVVSATSSAFAVTAVALLGRDWRYAVVLAPLAAVVALVVRGMHRAQRRAGVLLRLEGIAAALVGAGDPESVAQRAVELAAEMLGARRGELRVALPEGRDVRAGTSVRTADVTGRTIATLLEECGGRILVPPGRLEEPDGPAARLRAAVGAQDVVAVGVRARDEVAGWLLVADHRLSYTFDDVDLATLGTLADYVGLALLAADTASRLRIEATTDTLTGLANRRAFSERGAIAVAGGGSVLLIDLDGFKSVNDTLGHAAGDELLTLLARRLSHVSGRDAVVGRLGGDEFAVAHPPGVDAVAAGARLRLALAQPAEVAGARVVPAASVGVAVAPRDGGTLSELLAAADAAMYAAKQRKIAHHAS